MTTVWILLVMCKTLVDSNGNFLFEKYAITDELRARRMAMVANRNGQCSVILEQLDLDDIMNFYSSRPELQK